ncbi:unnamed protein product [Plutella xylostella]|uniref:(diamondback moth) hypothetical protein n=1 Tax=Plutella xylostella TaxID=51655 RepID=A0A8S4EM67_PLUXY|nr:unnamed protein product [Plutella xylostella]
MSVGGDGNVSSTTETTPALEEPEPSSQPYFDNATKREYTAAVGQPAYLHCRVKNLGDRARSWDDVASRASLDQLMDESNGAELARLRAVSKPEAGIWLHALPSPQLGTLLDNDSLRVAVRLRLGCKICEAHTYMCSMVDAQGRHGLHCVRSAGRLSRHRGIMRYHPKSLVSANIPSILEPPGLSRNDGKRPDGLTLIPWEKGRCLLWDATCVCTFAPSHVASTIATPGAAAELAAKQKIAKYSGLMDNYIFVPVATGIWGHDGKTFIKSIGRRMRHCGLDIRSGTFLMQRISLAVQRGNAASALGIFASDAFRSKKHSFFLFIVRL